MICSNCKKKFDNINGLKFCPYCGEKINEQIDLGVKRNPRKSKQQRTEPIKIDKANMNTLKMPEVTDKDIKKYNRNKFFANLIKLFIQKKVIVPMITIFIITVLGVFWYNLLIVAKPVEQVKINEDLIGKVITLSQSTNIEIKKSYIKNLSINSRNTDKATGKDDIKVAITLNNGVIEVKTLLSMLYVNKGDNKWQLSGKVDIVGEAAIKPLVAMDEKQFLEDLKKLDIIIDNKSTAVELKEAKSINISLKTPDLVNGKEEILVDLVFDGGVLTSTGKIKCKLIFDNEKWSINSIERNKNEDFVLALSTSLSQDRIIEIIKKAGLDESVTYKDLFSGKAFNVKDSFTKSITIADKKFDLQSKTLNVNAKRENTEGEIKSTLLTNYTLALSLKNIELLKKSQTTVSKATVNEIPNDLIKASIVNVDIEGGNLLFWFSDNHKITAEEAKTFKSSEILSKKGLNNIKYVYGNINYIDGKKKKIVSVVAIYFLVYDNSKGFSWKLDKVVSEESPNYSTYSKSKINQ